MRRRMIEILCLSALLPMGCHDRDTNEDSLSIPKTIWSWGSNDYGTLGTESVLFYRTTPNSNSPRRVSSK